MIALELEAFEHRKTEDSLRLAKEEAEVARHSAETANRAKSEFLSRMSHELRTPLNSILGFSQLLQRGEMLEKQQERIDLIVTAGEHLLALINDVLDIARVESGRTTLSIEPTQLAELMSETLSLVSPLATRHEVDLLCEPVNPQLYVLADRQKLQQVFLNLLSNAVKYNRPQGTVRLWCQETEDGTVRISVANTGKGIDPEHLSRVYLPFDRLDAENSEVEGTGLGLALTRSLVQAMNGAIEVQSTPGVETVFAVTMPRVDGIPAVVNSLDKQLFSGSAEGDLCILYIEDNLANIKLIQSIFSDRDGVSLITAMQGSLGVELGREHRPDVILLDLHLPDISGDEVLRRLQADPQTAAIPVVVLTADATERRSRQLRAMGAADYLTKPLDIELFLSSISRLTSKTTS